MPRQQFLEFLAHASAKIHGIGSVGEGREGVHLFAIKQDIELHQIGLAEAAWVVVKRGVAFGNGLELVVEINHNLAQGEVEINLHTVAGYVLLLDELASFVEAESHDRADEVRGGDNRRTNIGLFHMVNEGRVGHAGRIVHLVHLAVFGKYAIRNVGHSGNHVHVKLAVESLLHNLHVEQTEESASETETEGNRAFRGEGQ